MRIFFFNVMNKVVQKKDPIENIFYAFHWNIFNPVRFMQGLFELHTMAADSQHAIEITKDSKIKLNLDSAREYYGNYIAQLNDKQLEELHNYLKSKAVLELFATLDNMFENSNFNDEQMRAILAMKNLLGVTIANVQKAFATKENKASETKHLPIVTNLASFKYQTAVLAMLPSITDGKLKLYTSNTSTAYRSVPSLKEWVHDTYLRFRRRPI